MNITHMKYAMEIARTGSINRASENLLIAQPNLSRSIKELEKEFGLTIFRRTSKGMTLTPEGEEFLALASEVLNRLDTMEHLYKLAPKKQRFSISVPRASYISDAFARFSRNITADPAEIYYKETNSYRAIHNILDADYKLGILRYAEHFDKYFKDMLEEKELNCELIAEFKYVLIMNRKSPLTKLSEIHRADLRNYIEIAHADPFVPSLPFAEVQKEELPNTTTRRIFVYERASQFELLTENEQTYMWVSPLPPKLLDRYELSQIVCADNDKVYRDMLIYRKNYTLSELDKQFITELCNSKREHLRFND